MADRILGMGDIMSFVEKASEKIDMEEQTKAATRMMSGQFTLDDMLSQIRQINKLGSLGGIMKMMSQMSKTGRMPNMGALMGGKQRNNFGGFGGKRRR